MYGTVPRLVLAPPHGVRSCTRQYGRLPGPSQFTPFEGNSFPRGNLHFSPPLNDIRRRIRIGVVGMAAFHTQECIAVPVVFVHVCAYAALLVWVHLHHADAHPLRHDTHLAQYRTMPYVLQCMVQSALAGIPAPALASMWSASTQTVSTP